MKNSWIFLVLVFSGVFFSLPPQNISADDCLEAKRWYQKGLALSDNSPEEIAHYKKALELCPNYMEAHSRMGEIYKARHQWELAIQELQMACKEEDHPGPHVSLGEIYRMQRRYELAIREFQTALAIHPEEKRALNNLDYLYKTIGHYDDEMDEPAPIPSPIFSGEPGFTLPRGATTLNLHFQSLQIKQGLTTPGERAVDIWKLTYGLRYGLTGTFTFGIFPKMLWKKAYIYNPVGGEYQPSTYGLGDTVILLKYCLWSHRSNSLAASLHVNIPTGDEKRIVWDAGRDFPIPLGSGKYEFIPGIAFSTNLHDLGYLHTNLQYFFSRTKDKSSDTDSHELKYNLGFCRPIHPLGFPYFFSLPVTDFVLHMELNGIYLGKTEESAFYHGELQVYSVAGGNTIFVSPGVQLLLYSNLRLEFGIQYPVLLPDEPWISKPSFRLGLVKFMF